MLRLLTSTKKPHDPVLPRFLDSPFNNHHQTAVKTTESLLQARKHTYISILKRDNCKSDSTTDAVNFPDAELHDNTTAQPNDPSKYNCVLFNRFPVWRD
ncbi:hypothetical protein FDECE_4927 [Fusarium decemcellulare]|nr:hypothetical protein FDECE_4927 [Fusarium decemcellulare]